MQLTATGDFSDGTTEDLTTQVSWTLDNSAIAQVSDAAATNRLVTGVRIRKTPITTTLGGVQGSTTVTVTAAMLASIQITPANPSIAKGTTQLLTATGMFLGRDYGGSHKNGELEHHSRKPGNGYPNGLLMGTNVGAGLVRATLVQGAISIQETTSFTITPRS